MPTPKERKALTSTKLAKETRPAGLDRIKFTCYNIWTHPGVAQLVARLLWEQDAGSSSLPTRTKMIIRTALSKWEVQFVFFVSIQNIRFNSNLLIFSIAINA